MKLLFCKLSVRLRCCIGFCVVVIIGIPMLYMKSVTHLTLGCAPDRSSNLATPGAHAHTATWRAAQPSGV